MKLVDLSSLVSMTDWGIVESEGVWVGRVGDHGFIRIMPSTVAWEVAVDALTDFLDRLRTRTFPRHITDPKDIMKFCVRQARRQR